MITPKKEIIVSGMRPTGLLHLGHYFGVLKNWVALQMEYQCYFFVANWHALTTEYSNVAGLKESSRQMVVDWLASGVDPAEVTLFIQSQVPEHAELHVLLSMLTPISWLERVPSYKELRTELSDKDLSTYGFLGYPLLQTADVAIYKANRVPVGQDQVAHIELSREVIRRFHFLYKKEIFPEPLPLLTKTAKFLGTDGRKMSKSYNNSIYLSDSPEVMTTKIKGAMTDPARQRRTDPGNPDVCPIFEYHKQVTDTATRAQIDSDCRVAGIGCVDCKKIMIKNLLDDMTPFRDKRAQVNLNEVDDLLSSGAKKARVTASQTLAEVSEVMGL